MKWRSDVLHVARWLVENLDDGAPAAARVQACGHRRAKDARRWLFWRLVAAAAEELLRRPPEDDEDE